MAPRFAYFSPWRSEAVRCPICHWHGFLTSGSPETHAELVGYRCPECNEILAIIPYPTLKQMAEAAAKGNREAAQTLALYQRAAE